ncbi:MAG: CopG family ribbon-helix-helix protein [Rhodoferax sp.]|nr:CopG family ribbon-helix-helix protein [Rhodoferax sp.]
MTATATTTRPIAVKLDQNTRERIKRLADARHRSAHWMMREAIQQYIEREEKHETFRQDGIRAWNEYQATGLHVTLDEADAWLGKLETGQDVEPPECHG